MLIETVAAYHLECVASAKGGAGYGASLERQGPGSTRSGPHGRAEEEGSQFARHCCY